MASRTCPDCGRTAVVAEQEALELRRAARPERLRPVPPVPDVVALLALLPHLLRVHLLRVLHPLVHAVVPQELLPPDPEEAAPQPLLLPVRRWPRLGTPAAIFREACHSSRGLWN
jgi:hypothetical protein